MALLPVLAAASSSSGNEGFNQGYEAAVSEGSADETAGLALSGNPVTNIYAYDAAGVPLTGVQLFDQDGRPLDPFDRRPGDGFPCLSDECEQLFVPARLATGRDAYNVFPINVVKAAVEVSSGQNVPDPASVAAPPPAPFAQVPAVQAPQPVAQPNE